MAPADYLVGSGWYSLAISGASNSVDSMNLVKLFNQERKKIKLVSTTELDLERGRRESQIAKVVYIWHESTY